MVLENNLNFLLNLEESFSNILFFEKEHKYTINNETAKYSVSQLIKKYETPFNADDVSIYVAKRDGLSQKDVLKKWDFEKDYSCHKGSEFHKIVDNFFSRKSIKIDKDAIEFFFEKRKQYKTNNCIEKYYNEVAKLIKNFKSFYNWWKEDHILIKSEFVIGDKTTLVCGTIDNLSYNKKTKEFVIFDYKTNKQIKKNNPYQKLTGSLSHFEQCEYIKYSLQLSLYSIIMEKVASIQIPNSYIVWMNAPDDYELIKCLDLKKESNLILNECK